MQCCFGDEDGNSENTFEIFTSSESNNDDGISFTDFSLASDLQNEK